jgi:hypothetical protein
MEAYQAVYTPQELTEEQVWEEVEEWVNALVEEGYDLSDYTWEEMYEAYSQLDEAAAIPVIQAGLRAAPYVLPAIGAATKWLQGRGQSKPKPVDYGQGSFSSTKDKPAPKPSWEKTTTRPPESSTRMPSPARPPEKKPTEEQKAAAKAAAEKQLAAQRAAASAKKEAQVTQPNPPAQSPKAEPPAQPKPPARESKPATSLGLRKAAKGVTSAVVRASTSGPGKTLLKYGVGVPLVGGLATGAAVDVKRAATGQSSATQRLSGALQGGAGNVLKTVGNVGAAIPGVKDTGTPQEIKQTGEYLKKAGKDTQKKVDVKRYVELNQSVDLLDIVKNYLIDNNYSNDEESALSIIENMSDKWIENILEAPELGSTNAQGKFYTGSKYGYQSRDTALKNRLLPSEVLGSEPPKKASSTPAPSLKPEPQRGSTNAQGKFYTGKQYGYQSWQTASSKGLLPSEVLGSEPPKKASSTPASTTQPATTRPASTTQPATTRPASTTQPATTRPAASTQPASTRPAASTQPASTRPAASAQTGDRTKDLTTWATTPKNKVMINKVGTPQQKEILSAAEKGTAMPAPRPISKDVEDIRKMQAASRERQGVKESYDAYDLVLEYLLSQGHADTLEEANYVMLEMDAEMIGGIVDIFYK